MKQQNMETYQEYIDATPVTVGLGFIEQMRIDGFEFRGEDSKGILWYKRQEFEKIGVYLNEE